MQPNSSSVAAPERLRFMPVHHIAFFFLLVLGVLVLVFPGQKLGHRLLDSTTPNALSLAYLKVWLNADPSDINARLLLTQQQIAASLPDAATQTLSPLASDQLSDAQQQQSQLLRLGILEQYVWQSPSDSQARHLALTFLTHQLTSMQQMQWSYPQSLQLAKTAAQFGETDLTLFFLTNSWQQQPRTPSSTDDEVAQLLLDQQQYRAAANIHFHSMSLASSNTQRRQYFIAGLRALQAGNLLDAAMQAATHYGQPLQQDAPTLRFLIRLSLAANRPQQASRYAAQLLKQDSGVLKQNTGARP